jgi:hypothetical protein
VPPTSKPRAGKEDGDQSHLSRTAGALRHPLAITAVSVLVASWLLPSVTKQWQDRQEARELKEELVAKLDEATTRTVIATRILVDRSSPRAQTTRARELELKGAPNGERAGARAAFLAAVEQERNATAESYIQIISDWLVTRSVTRSQLLTYFPDSDVADDWTEYANHVTRYVRLASSNSEADKLGYVRRLASYLGVGDAPPRWRLLAKDPRTLEGRQSTGFVRGNVEVTELLLRKKNALVRAIADGHVAGFSTNSGDLLRDLLPVYG